MTRFPGLSSGRAPGERLADVGTLIVLVASVLAGVKVTTASMSLVPEYDALSYLNDAFHLFLAFSGTPGEHLSWAHVPFTNTLDAIVVALLWKLTGFQAAVWAVQTAYLVLFVGLARRIFSPAETLMLLAWAVAQTRFLPLYTSFISELKVGLMLVLFVAYLFHPRAREHPVALFVITLLLIGLRTIDLLFVAPLCLLYAGLRFLQPPRRGEIMPTLAPVVAAGLLFLPVLYFEGRKLLVHVGYTLSATRQNWQDMTGVHGRFDLLAAYWTGVGEYNVRLRTLTVAAVLVVLVVLATRHRARLRPLFEPFLATLAVFVVLMNAASTNSYVIFWVYMMIGLLATLLLDALAPRGLFLALVMLLAATALIADYAGLRIRLREIPLEAPVSVLSRDIAQTLREYPSPVVFANFGGVGALDIPGLELAAGRTLGAPQVDAVRYDVPFAAYLQALADSNVALIANRNFFFTPYWGINQNTAAIAQEMRSHATEWGWLPVRQLLVNRDPGRSVDVYVRPWASVLLKYTRWRDLWMDDRTPVVLQLPAGTHVPPGYSLQLHLAVPGVADPAFQPPWTVTLLDVAGRSVASTQVANAGESTVALPVDGLAPGEYELRFDKTFSNPPDPRKLSAQLLGVAVRFTG